MTTRAHFGQLWKILIACQLVAILRQASRNIATSLDPLYKVHFGPHLAHLCFFLPAESLVSSQSYFLRDPEGLPDFFAVKTQIHIT
jgi:hypothetical protein